MYTCVFACLHAVLMEDSAASGEDVRLFSQHCRRRNSDVIRKTWRNREGRCETDAKNAQRAQYSTYDVTSVKAEALKVPGVEGEETGSY